LVSLLLLLPGLFFDVRLFGGVALLFLGELTRRLFRDGRVSAAARLRDRRLDSLGLVIGPLVGCLGLEARRLGLQDERVINGRAGPQRRDRGERREERRRQRDSFQERSAVLFQLFVDRFVQAFGLDLGSFGHLAPRSLRLAAILPEGETLHYETFRPT